MEEIRDLFAVRAPFDRVRRASGESVGGINGLDGQLLRGGGGTDERRQEKRKKKPFHGHTPRGEVKRRSVTLGHSREHSTKPLTAATRRTQRNKGIKE